MPLRLDGGLAVLGAAPTFDAPRHVGCPNVPEMEALRWRLEDALRRRYLTNSGPFVEEFEQKVAERLGVRHCIATCNATVGLMVVARALELTGEVVMPSFTFIGTAHAVRWLGLRPVFSDVGPKTHTIDPARVEDAITEETSAILGVHAWGRACDTETLQTIAERRGVQLFFDAAPAFDCSHRGAKIGSFGSAEVVSFHATKVLNTFEGGAILTNDDDLADRFRRMGRFGFEDEDLVLALGVNAKMSEAAAAMGLAQLERLDEFIAVNREHLATYRERLSGLPGISMLSYPEEDTPNYHYVVIEVDSSRAPFDRDTLKRVLVAENVLARRYFYPGCHRMVPYAAEQPSVGDHLPETAALVDRVLQLPTGTAVTPSDVEDICAIIHRAFDQSDAIEAVQASAVP
jgi:dTDP-4-amino-4,6-dideoxygalactose transaminase